MASEQHGLGPELQRLTSGHISSGFVLNQDVSTSAKPLTKNDWDAVFQPMFDEYFKPSSVVSTSISAATLLPSDTAGASFSSSINKDAPTPNTSSAESSSMIIDSSNMHTFQQHYVNTKRWIKDHPLVIIIGNPSKPISTRCQLATDALWCYFHAFLVKEEPTNYKEAMIQSSWVEAMQEDIHEFERPEV
ncbi:hypothetical protein Tco_0134503 [Tanacetum coccineum]